MESRAGNQNVHSCLSDHEIPPQNEFGRSDEKINSERLRPEALLNRSSGGNRPVGAQYS